MAHHQDLPDEVPVLIAGGGPVGLTLAALLARHGIRSLVAEADGGVCTGSRAICVSRRSQEILAWAGAGAAMAAKALPWTGGRSYWRDAEVLRFQMPSEPTQRFAPMVNIQQYHVEQFLLDALAGAPEVAQVAMNMRLTALTQDAQGVTAELETPEGMRQVRARYLAACDGGRSTVREQLGLQLEGTQYDGRYVIVDVVQETQRPVERLAWFDPPSNPGSTILMHRQPEDVWRIDYQLRDDEDGAEALKPENILPRVQSHLAMIGETAPWRMLWASMYNAKCLTLPDYRHGHVFFAGDAAHLVPIFGVRGLNSGLDDAGNLAWKLARVLDGDGDDALLATYSAERVPAARENIAYGAKSTEFMAPPNFAFSLMREATLRLALEDPLVRPLINPRQSAPVAYAGSALNGESTGEWMHGDAAPGLPAPEALLAGSQGEFHLSQAFGKDFVALVFSDGVLPLAAAGLPEEGVAVLHIPPEADPLRQAGDRYGLPRGGEGLVLVRPDGYVAGRWRGTDPAPLVAWFKRKEFQG
ncbi:FAD-dependent oxidoreductase [Caenimonas sedimenti]|uniref:FAD-dependent oxidoreductase n=1 Tax=Caenimonas sedimenti TaxID=2596921 RepID=A0A562ZU37_9BURK|nr:FAD-dependent monooxygenase [Caenimonas sedimenti]TWO71876.1 FAD-dependent oxidoreductase [Caenimonas sedimenti]